MQPGALRSAFSIEIHWLAELDEPTSPITSLNCTSVDPPGFVDPLSPMVSDAAGLVVGTDAVTGCVFEVRCGLSTIVPPES